MRLFFLCLFLPPRPRGSSLLLLLFSARSRSPFLFCTIASLSLLERALTRSTLRPLFLLLLLFGCVLNRSERYLTGMRKCIYVRTVCGCYVAPVTYVYALCSLQRPGIQRISSGDYEVGVRGFDYYFAFIGSEFDFSCFSVLSIALPIGYRNNLLIFISYLPSSVTRKIRLCFSTIYTTVPPFLNLRELSILQLLTLCNYIVSFHVDF
jgi:hypothetical protein